MLTPTFTKSNASRLSPAGNPFDIPEIDFDHELVRAGTLFTATTKTVGTKMGTPTLDSLIMTLHNINAACRRRSTRWPGSQLPNNLPAQTKRTPSAFLRRPSLSYVV